MTRRILVTIAAAISLVLLALLIPLWVLVGEFAVDRAQNEVSLEVQPLVALVGATAGQTPTQPLSVTVANFNAGSKHPATVYLDGGTVVVGPGGPADAAVRAMFTAARPQALFVPITGGRELLDPVQASGATYAVVRVFIPQADLMHGVTKARLALLALGLVLLALALLVGYQLARSFLIPIRRLSDGAEALAAGDLSTQVRPGGPPEIRQIGDLLNRMAARMEELLRGEREQVADIAHRLRTPVTALRLDADGLANEQERQRLAHDVDELERMVDAVITEARRPVRGAALPLCDVAVVLLDRVAFWSVLAEDQGRFVHVDVPAGRYPVRLDAAELGDALDALVGNVFEHTPEGSTFAVRLATLPDGRFCVTVDDTGPGFPDREVVGRGHSAGGGTGLGLDIARRTAESSGGSLVVGRSAAGGGRVQLLLGQPSSPGTDARPARRARRSPGSHTAAR